MSVDISECKHHVQSKIGVYLIKDVSKFFTMELSAPLVIKTLLKGIMYAGLLTIFYFFYMKHALEQYSKGITALGEREIKVDQYDHPIFIICPDPGFNNSFFSEINDTSANFWWYKYKKYENMVDLYKNMSYIGLGEQWDIQIYDEIEK